MKFLCIFLTAFLSFGALAEVKLPAEIPKIRWTPDPLYSEEGFRLGTIIRFGEHWFWHFEGQLMMGFDSNPGILMDHDCERIETKAADRLKNEKKRQAAIKNIATNCLIGANPWPFSVVDRNLFNQIGSSSVTPVVVYYTRAIASPAGAVLVPSAKALFTSTDNYVTQIWPIDPNFPAPSVYTEGSGELPPSDKVAFSSGTIQGHIVKASMDHLLFKTYEIVVQQSQGGSNFIRLSVDDSKLFDHIVMMMLTGKELKLNFTQLFSIEGYWLSIFPGYSTYYRVTSVQISDEQPPMKENSK
jgi:hypothetical protein